MQNIKIKINDEYELIPFNKKFINNENNIKSNYYSWAENEIVTKHNIHGLMPKSKKEMESFFDDIENNKILCFAIIGKKENIHVGNISLQRFDWINRSAELAIIIGEPDYYGKGIGTAACKAIVDHGFNKLNLERCWSGTAETNIGMQKIFEKLGFKKEGEFINAMFLDGRYVNIYEYGLIRK